MANSNPNDVGRALEYSIVDYIQKNHNKVLLSDGALLMQKRDSIKFEKLQQNLKERFLVASQKFLAWFLSLNVNKTTITIDRFNDNSGSPHDPDYLLQVDTGIFRIFDSSNNANKLLAGGVLYPLVSF